MLAQRELPWLPSYHPTRPTVQAATPSMSSLLSFLICGEPVTLALPIDRQRPSRGTGRTRKDPFEAVWTDILLWLQEDPETTAKSLFQRLCQQYPGRFPDGQLRTLQGRIESGVRSWQGSWCSPAAKIPNRKYWQSGSNAAHLSHKKAIPASSVTRSHPHDFDGEKTDTKLRARNGNTNRQFNPTTPSAAARDPGEVSRAAVLPSVLMVTFPGEATGWGKVIVAEHLKPSQLSMRSVVLPWAKGGFGCV